MHAEHLNIAITCAANGRPELSQAHSLIAIAILLEKIAMKGETYGR